MYGGLSHGIDAAWGELVNGLTRAWEAFEKSQAPDRHLIRARTQDNPHLPEGFIDSLLANYPEQLIRAYLDGQFVNLNTGAVYDRFDRAKHVVAEEYDALQMEPLRIGIDFNVTNMSAVVAVRLYLWSMRSAEPTTQMHSQKKYAVDIRIIPSTSTLTPQGPTAAPTPPKPTSAFWKATGLRINPHGAIPPYVIGLLLFRLFWRMAKVKSGSRFSISAFG